MSVRGRAHIASFVGGRLWRLVIAVYVSAPIHHQSLQRLATARRISPRRMRSVPLSAATHGCLFAVCARFTYHFYCWRHSSLRWHPARLPGAASVFHASRACPAGSVAVRWHFWVPPSSSRRLRRQTSPVPSSTWLQKYETGSSVGSCQGRHEITSWRERVEVR